MAYILAVGYVGVSILLCGLFVRPSQLKIRPLLWLSYLSYPRQGHQHWPFHPTKMILVCSEAALSRS